jgi:hypothetical protein
VKEKKIGVIYVLKGVFRGGNFWEVPNHVYSG